MLEAEHALPIGMLHRMRDHPGQNEKVLAGLDASNACLHALYLNGTERLRMLVRIVLLQRLRQQDAGAGELMRRYLGEARTVARDR